MKLSPFRILAIVAIAIMLSACGSSGGKLPELPEVSDLPAPSSVDTVEQAQRALVMAQQIRVAARDYLAARIRADGVISDAEIEQAKRFDQYDSMFTKAWALADRGVTLWQRSGAKSADWEQGYSELLNYLLIPNGLRAVAAGVENAETQ